MYIAYTQGSLIYLSCAPVGLLPADCKMPNLLYSDYVTANKNQYTIIPTANICFMSMKLV